MITTDTDIRPTGAPTENDDPEPAPAERDAVDWPMGVTTDVE